MFCFNWTEHHVRHLCLHFVIHEKWNKNLTLHVVLLWTFENLWSAPVSGLCSMQLDWTSVNNQPNISIFYSRFVMSSWGDSGFVFILRSVCTVSELTSSFHTVLLRHMITQTFLILIKTKKIRQKLFILSGCFILDSQDVSSGPKKNICVCVDVCVYGWEFIRIYRLHYQYQLSIWFLSDSLISLGYGIKVKSI